MISVDISNIWCSVSLPDLLAQEKAVFDAHLRLGGGEYKNNPWFHWLEPSLDAQRTWVSGVVTAAERIRSNSQILVVVGGGLAAAGARAAIRLLPGRTSSLRLLFVGEDYSSEKWLRVASALEGTDFSVLAMASGKQETAALVALRSLRWIMEKRYGSTAKDRIYIAPPTPGSALARLADALGCQTLAMPNDLFAPASTLNPGALLILAAAGFSPSLVFSGAAELLLQTDIRSFDNPLWLYAAARKLLGKDGRCSEIVCTTDPAADAFGGWWQRTMAFAGNKNGVCIPVQHARLPEDFFLLGDSFLQPGQFASVLRLTATAKKVTVETDWSDPDGLNALAGLDLSVLENRTLEAIADAFQQQDVPYLTIECDEPLTDDKVGELLCFTELSAALSACVMDAEPAAQQQSAAVLRDLDAALGRN